MFIIFKYFIFFIVLFKQVLIAENLEEYQFKTIAEQCKDSLDFYKERPDLETEFLNRLEFCKSTVKNVSPIGYEVNPIISDFKSMYGVNGRTRMQLHQGIDIIGHANEPIIAIADGIVLETEIDECMGPTLVINHNTSFDNKNLITIYTHIGDFLVKEGDLVKRGTKVAKLPEKINYPCMARVRHLHLQIGQQYCEKAEKNKWGCGFFIKDLYSSLNPHDYWADGPSKISCYDKDRKYKKGVLTYPFKCNTYKK